MYLQTDESVLTSWGIIDCGAFPAAAKLATPQSAPSAIVGRLQGSELVLSAMRCLYDTRHINSRAGYNYIA
jgi:hypothetical protein